MRYKGWVIPFSFDAVIFDLDGTLVDSLADIGGAMNHALAERNLPVHPLESYRQFVGEGLEQLGLRVLPESHEGLLPGLLTDYRERYLTHFADQTVPYPGVIELLSELVRRQVPLAVLSNKRDDFTRAVVEALLPLTSFREVRGEREGVPRKPDPQAALEIAASLKVAPHRCAFVGDTGVDMRTATAAGMVGVGVLWGFRDRRELEGSGAQALLRTPEELLSLFPAT